MADGTSSAAVAKTCGHSRREFHSLCEGCRATNLEPVEVRPLPSLEEFARFLLDRDGAQEREARIAQKELLSRYAAVWANYEGLPNALAQAHAESLFEEMTMTADERQAEADFSSDDGR